VTLPSHCRSRGGTAPERGGRDPVHTERVIQRPPPPVASHHEAVHWLVRKNWLSCPGRDDLPVGLDGERRDGGRGAVALLDGCGHPSAVAEGGIEGPVRAVPGQGEVAVVATALEDRSSCHDLPV